jgi:hypothetical protein
MLSACAQPLWLQRTLGVVGSTLLKGILRAETSVPRWQNPEAAQYSSARTHHQLNMPTWRRNRLHMGPGILCTRFTNWRQVWGRKQDTGCK